jgi:hypothetical protein
MELMDVKVRKESVASLDKKVNVVLMDRLVYLARKEIKVNA